VSVAEEEVHLTGSYDGDLEAALARIEHRIKSVEDSVEELGVKSEAAGKVGGKGFNEFGDQAEKAGNKARRAKRPIGEAGDEAAKSGAKAAAGASGFKKLGDNFTKAGKKGGGLGSIFKVFKLTALVTGAFALAGGLSALGAGGAIAVGGLAPLVGVAAGALPIFAAAKLSMLAWKLAATQLEQPLTRIKNQFTELGPTIARGGLLSGVDYFANSLGKLSKVSGKGLAGLGGELGQAARGAGDIAKSSPFLDQVSAIFAGLRPILGYVLAGLLDIAQAVVNVLQAALPMGTEMGHMFADIASYLKTWTAAQLASGKLTAWLNHSWELFVQVVGVVVDFVIGLYNVFKIAAGFSRGLGQSVHDLAWEFRVWTTTAEGQQRITKYFQDSLPALREMGKLLGFVVGGLAHLGANQNVAPLLAQINSQLLPALANLVTKLSGAGGLGPALIDTATQLATLFAGLDFSGIGVFIGAIDGMLKSLIWLQQNVPGANMVISSLLFTLLGFKLMGPVFSVIGKGFIAFAWMETALTTTKNLSAGQRLFFQVMRGGQLALVNIGGAVVKYVLPALKMIATVGIGAIRALSVALFTTPIGWIILAIIAVVAAIYLLWTKCAWFRDLVMAVWSAIKTAAIATWNALKTAFFAVVDALVTGWDWVKNAAMAVWNWLKTAWQATVDFIIMVAMWIWDHGLKQVFNVIVTYVTIYFNVIKFIIQTAIYIIVGIITLIAIVAKFVFDSIVAAVKWFAGVFTWLFNMMIKGAIITWNWLWTKGIKPVIDFFVAAWNDLVAKIQMKWALFVAFFTAVWNALWIGVIKPVIDFFVGAWNTAVGIIQNAANMLWLGIQLGIQIFWNWVSPFFTGIANAGAAVWTFISSSAASIWAGVTKVWNDVSNFLSGLWDGMTAKGTKVWDAIKSAASAVGDAVKGVWDGIKGAVAGVWNFLARGWNSIPDITVPDWVPLIGGKTFGLPKLPMLYRGGEAPGGRAIVGEQGPEPLVVNGRYAGMVGQNGPEVASIPRGGYVVPNLSTLDSLPGLTKSLPTSVASAVARSVPGYAPRVRSDSSAAIARELGALRAALANQLPPVTVNGGGSNTYDEVRRAVKSVQAEQKLTSKYHYSAGQG
jgi:phage-related protein